MIYFFFFQAEDGIRDVAVTGVQTCALPISHAHPGLRRRASVLPLRSSIHSPREVFLPRFDGAFINGHEDLIVSVGGEIGRASCRERSVDLGGRRIIKKKKKKKKKTENINKI